MITALFLAVVFFAVYRLFFSAEDIYAYGVNFESTVKNPEWVKKIVLMVGVPLIIAFLMFTFFKSKIKLK